MSSTLQLSNVRHHFTTFFRQLLSQTPPVIPGLFCLLDYQIETWAWPLILYHYDTSSKLCQLVRMEFCKTKHDKLREFLVLYFSHANPTVTARAGVVVERTIMDCSPSSDSPNSPSQTITEAYDGVHVMARRNNLKTYLSQTYTNYETIRVLRYTSSTASIPSATQISTLLLAATNHQKTDNLCEYDCHWYASTVFEACKSLFPGYEEACTRHGDCDQYRLKVPVLVTNSLPRVCEEYHVAWLKHLQRRTTNQGPVGQRVLERTPDEQRKALEAAQQAWEQELEEQKAAHEAARQEWERKLEEVQRRCEQLQAELQAIQQAQQRTPMH